MDNKSILVKEVILRRIETKEIEGSIATPNNLKAIRQVEHHILSQQSKLGTKCVAYFGEISFRITYVDRNENYLRQVEQALSFRGLSYFEASEDLDEVEIRVQPSVQDIFTEKEESNLIKIFGFLTVEIIVIKEKELSMNELQVSNLEILSSDYDQKPIKNNIKNKNKDKSFDNHFDNKESDCSAEIKTNMVAGKDK